MIRRTFITMSAVLALTGMVCLAHASVSAKPVQAAAVVQDKLNVNTATAKELSKIKGLTLPKARAIVSFRKKHGNFKTLDDLSDVKSVKKLSAKTFKDIQSHLTVA